VRVFRYVQIRMVTEVATATGPEKLTYKHGAGSSCVRRWKIAVNGDQGA